MSTITTTKIPFANGYTWARITTADSPIEGAKPLIILHGGPGFCHNYLLPLEQLADLTGRTVVHYDQYGCGNSTHEPDAPAEMWTPQFFVDEFTNLLSFLEFNEVHVLGQSWGGMLASEIGIRRIPEVKSLAICNSPASMKLWSEAAAQLRSQLPTDIRATLEKYEATCNYDNPEYIKASKYYDSQHVVRLPGGHPAYEESKKQVEKDPTVYHTMNGPNEFHVIGTLKDWSIIDELESIDVPTLILAGEFDEAQPIVWEPFVEKIPNVKGIEVKGASHATHLEKPEEFNAIISSFLSEVETEI